MTTVIDLPSILQGDSLDKITLPAMLNDAGQLIIPTSVCAQLMDEFSRPVHQWVAEIDQVTGKVTLPAIIDTHTLRAARYNYGARYSLPNGKQRVVYVGCLHIIGSGTKC